MSDQHIVEEEIYTHEYLWRSSNVLAEVLRSDVEGKNHLVLPALVMTLMAFEAFVNFCGFVLLPDVWSKEREHFKGKGVDDRVQSIVERLPKFEWKKGEYPYQGIKRLFQLRDLVAHGKVQATQYESQYQSDGSHFRWEHRWDSHLSEDSVERARREVRAFAQSLIVAMRDVSDHPHLFFDAFEGSLASASGVAAPKKAPQMTLNSVDMATKNRLPRTQGRGPMWRWVLIVFLGIVLWYALTFAFGTVWGALGLPYLREASPIFNFVLLLPAFWIARRMIL